MLFVQKSRTQVCDGDLQLMCRKSVTLKNGLSSFSNPYSCSSRQLTTGSKCSMQKQLQQWEHEKEIMFRHSLGILREQIYQAKELVNQANSLAQEIGKLVKFYVTLQIPVSYLSLNRRKNGFMSEPAILVKHKDSSSQVWPIEKLEHTISGMKEIYRRYKGNSTSSLDQSTFIVADPFDEPTDCHSLVGVASIFLQCLFCDVELDHFVPIINQQGEVAGKLHIQISLLGGALLDEDTDTASSCDYSVLHGAHVVIRLCIMEAQGLPEMLFNSLFCQYHFWGDSEATIVPAEESETLTHRDNHATDFVFNHEQYMQVPISEAFIDFCLHGALSIEVWGHKRKQYDMDLITNDTTYFKTRHVTNQWIDVVKKIEFWAEIHESNNQGVYSPVEVTPKPDVPCAGIVQLREGNSRQVLVRVCPVANSGTLPLICESISAVAIGCICVKSCRQKGLDSYQKEDLAVLKDHWLKALIRRKKYFDEQIQMLTKKRDKSEVDSERERSLIKQRICLMEEHNTVLFPSPGSNIPGAPVSWTPPPNMEEHSPVLFLDLTSEDIYTSNSKVGLQAVGINSLLLREQSTEYADLPIIKNFVDKNSVCALASWDTSGMNKSTAANERVYMILKVVVHLSHPASIDLVLRKRICVSINKKQSLSSFTSMLKNRIIGQDHFSGSGVVYEIVSNLPKSLEDLEEMETLGQVAASQDKVSAVDGETYLERYMRGVAAVDRILIMDRLRQEVAVREKLLNADCSNSSLRRRRVRSLSPNFDDENTGQKIDPQEYCDPDLDLLFENDDYQHCELHHCQQSCSLPLTITPSSTIESFLNDHTKGITASLTSSGYESQAVSTMTLSAEDFACISNHDGSGENDHPQDKLHSMINHDLDENHNEAAANKTVKVEICKQERVSDVIEKSLSSIRRDSETADINTDFHEDSCFTEKISTISNNSSVTSQQKHPHLVCSFDNNYDGKKDRKCEDKPQDCNPLTSSNSTVIVDEKEKLSQMDKKHRKTADCSRHGLTKTKILNAKKLASTLKCNQNDQKQNAPRPKSSADLLKSQHLHGKNVVIKTSSLMSSSASSLSSSSSTTQNNNMKTQSNKSLHIYGNKKDVVRHKESQLPTQSILMGDLPKQKIVSQRLQEKDGCCKVGQRLDEHTSGKDSNGHSFSADIKMSQNGTLSIEFTQSWDGTFSADIKDGENVIVSSSKGLPKAGIVKFIGTVHFARGPWVGVELDEAEGKTDGSIKGVRYFHCRPKHGLFVQYDKLVQAKKRKHSAQQQRMSGSCTSLTGSISRAEWTNDTQILHSSLKKK